MSGISNGTLFPSSGRTPTSDDPMVGTTNADDTGGLMQRTLEQYPILNKYRDQLAITFTPAGQRNLVHDWPIPSKRRIDRADSRMIQRSANPAISRASGGSNAIAST